MYARCMFVYVCIILNRVRHRCKQTLIFSSTNHGQYFCSCVFVFNVSSQFIMGVNVQSGLRNKSIDFDIEIAMWLMVWDDRDEDDEEELVFGHSYINMIGGTCKLEQ